MAKTTISVNTSNDELAVDIDRVNQLVRIRISQADVSFELIAHVQDGLKLALALRDAIAEIDRGK